jgi:hypothetical protein
MFHNVLGLKLLLLLFRFDVLGIKLILGKVLIRLTVFLLWVLGTAVFIDTIFYVKIKEFFILIRFLFFGWNFWKDNLIAINFCSNWNYLAFKKINFILNRIAATYNKLNVKAAELYSSKPDTGMTCIPFFCILYVCRWSNYLSVECSVTKI